MLSIVDVQFNLRNMRWLTTKPGSSDPQTPIQHLECDAMPQTQFVMLQRALYLTMLIPDQPNI